ncbi:MAG: hypothetical protein AB8F94_21485 [Saprospiraceae bacterium]
MGNNILDEVESDDYPKYGQKGFQYFLKAFLSLFGLFFLSGIIKGYFNLGPAQYIDLIFLIMFVVFSFLGWKNFNRSSKLTERTTSKTTCGEIGIILFIGIIVLLLILIVVPMISFLGSLITSFFK